MTYPQRGCCCAKDEAQCDLCECDTVPTPPVQCFNIHGRTYTMTVQGGTWSTGITVERKIGTSNCTPLLNCAGGATHPGCPDTVYIPGVEITEAITANLFGGNWVGTGIGGVPYEVITFPCGCNDEFGNPITVQVFNYLSYLEQENEPGLPPQGTLSVTLTNTTNPIAFTFVSGQTWAGGTPTIAATYRRRRRTRAGSGIGTDEFAVYSCAQMDCVIMDVIVIEFRLTYVSTKQPCIANYIAIPGVEGYDSVIGFYYGCIDTDTAGETTYAIRKFKLGKFQRSVGIPGSTVLEYMLGPGPGCSVPNYNLFPLTTCTFNQAPLVDNRPSPCQGFNQYAPEYAGGAIPDEITVTRQ